MIPRREPLKGDIAVVANPPLLASVDQTADVASYATIPGPANALPGTSCRIAGSCGQTLQREIIKGSCSLQGGNCIADETSCHLPDIAVCRVQSPDGSSGDAPAHRATGPGSLRCTCGRYDG